MNGTWHLIARLLQLSMGIETIPQLPLLKMHYRANGFSQLDQLLDQQQPGNIIPRVKPSVLR
jgi:NADH:ubiquinone oxidoreductase subunit F (NADH-binding)